VPAMIDNATPACAARVDTVPSTSAPPELLPDVAFPLAAEALGAISTVEVVTVLKPDCETAKGVFKGEFDGTATEGTTATLETGTTEVAFVAVLFEVVLLPPGAGTALDGSTRAPMPQGIAEPSGWVRLGAGTV